jgi:antibiotic biosynthesis monooxygenase (ABM) superfamily enzyme
MHSPSPEPPITAVVRRRIRPGVQAEFETAMQEFIHHALTFPGHRGISVLRPAGNSPRDYTVVDQFVDRAARRAFTSSPAYRSWMARLGVLTEGDPVIVELEGLNSWFIPSAGSAGARPHKGKIAVVTFIGVYPLTSLLPPLLGRLLPTWHPLIVNVAVSGLIVALLTWVIMPRLTRIFAGWLYDEPNFRP